MTWTGSGKRGPVTVEPGLGVSVFMDYTLYNSVAGFHKRGFMMANLAFSALLSLELEYLKVQNPDLHVSGASGFMGYLIISISLPLCG
jgi:hypothetical protein